MSSMETVTVWNPNTEVWEYNPPIMITPEVVYIPDPEPQPETPTS